MNGERTVYTEMRKTNEGVNAAIRDIVSAMRCADCGKTGERTGHQDCQFPQDHE